MPQTRNFVIPTSLEPDVIDIWCFRLWLLLYQKVWNIYGLHHHVVIWDLENFWSLKAISTPLQKFSWITHKVEWEAKNSKILKVFVFILIMKCCNGYCFYKLSNIPFILRNYVYNFANFFFLFFSIFINDIPILVVHSVVNIVNFINVIGIQGYISYS